MHSVSTNSVRALLPESQVAIDAKLGRFFTGYDRSNRGKISPGRTKSYSPRRSRIPTDFDRTSHRRVDEVRPDARAEPPPDRRSGETRRDRRLDAGPPGTGRPPSPDGSGRSRPAPPRAPRWPQAPPPGRQGPFQTALRAGPQRWGRENATWRACLFRPKGRRLRRGRRLGMPPASRAPPRFQAKAVAASGNPLSVFAPGFPRPVRSSCPKLAEPSDPDKRARFSPCHRMQDACRRIP